MLLQCLGRVGCLYLFWGVRKSQDGFVLLIVMAVCACGVLLNECLHDTWCFVFLLSLSKPDFLLCADLEGSLSTPAAWCSLSKQRICPLSYDLFVCFFILPSFYAASPTSLINTDLKWKLNDIQNFFYCLNVKHICVEVKWFTDIY